jgi:hypothetical protein
VGDVPVIAPLVNSFAAQEFGQDAGDYFRADGARIGYRHSIGTRGEWSVTAVREHITSLAVTAAPATGTFRPNPGLGGAGLSVLQAGVRRRTEGFAVRRDLHLALMVEGGRLDGAAGTTYWRAAGSGHVLLPIGGTRVLARLQAGAGSVALPRHHAFVLGGRGTLVGDDFRQWGGRQAGLAHVEWRVPVTAFRLRAGAYASVPGTVVVAPFVATGWTGAPVAGTPWVATTGSGGAGGARVTVGMGLEWMGLIRVETGVDLQTRRARFTFDVTRDFWGIL